VYPIKYSVRNLLYEARKCEMRGMHTCTYIGEARRVMGVRTCTCTGEAGESVLVFTTGFSAFGDSGFTGDGGLATFFRVGISKVCGAGSCLTGDGGLNGLSAAGGGADAATLVSTGAAGLLTGAGAAAATGANVFAIDTSTTGPSAEYNCSRLKSGTLASFPPNHSDDMRPGRPLGAGG